ncbi:MAG: hypothetical protein IJW82_00305 [Clostridia bacterium]|nr:hypothetical protein [Clostridia bacterium]
MYNQIINCIPSKVMRDYLKTNKKDFCILQQASIVVEFGNDDKKINLLENLLQQASTEKEKLLLSAAIKDLKKFGKLDKETDNIYKEYFYKKFETPLYPLSEICNLPILFKKGDIIKRVGCDDLYYLEQIPILKNWSDFTDECYLCYLITQEIKSQDDLFVFHSHIHLCEAEKVCANDLTKEQLSIVENIKKLLESY